jgi:hypothetical protein
MSKEKLRVAWQHFKITWQNKKLNINKHSAIQNLFLVKVLTDKEY